MSKPNSHRCEHCERFREDVAPAETKAHGTILLCAECFEYADARGALKSDQPQARRRA